MKPLGVALLTLFVCITNADATPLLLLTSGAVVTTSSDTTIDRRDNLTDSTQEGVATVAEPISTILLGSGLVGLVSNARRRKN
jgi:hypothetical protein